MASFYCKCGNEIKIKTNKECMDEIKEEDFIEDFEEAYEEYNKQDPKS